MRSGRDDILDSEGVQRALPRYADVVRKKKFSKYLISKSMPVQFNIDEPEENLWEKHDYLLNHFNEEVEKIDKKSERLKNVSTSFLELKARLGYRIMSSCRFCERECLVDRLSEAAGYCGAGRQFSLYSAFPHLGEEPELVPSGTVFTGGCTIRCIHCQNWDISQWKSSGRTVDPKMMAIQVEELANRGCKNINMVGGDPTPVTWQWIETMTKVDRNLATIWNSNSYYSEETSKLLAGFIDLYLLDFKYGNNKCAEEISDAPGYWKAATRNHLMADKHGEIIIRVLVLPGHNECCTRPILQWIYDNLGPWARINLMFQYRPEWRARERKELSRRLTGAEIREAKQMATDIGLRNLVRG
ncbi:radical SAM protein [Candidatus Bathyarchaeota archaeon]|nr:radical SAM protein [Candidatus Bathyarchaeota archaeon]